MTKKRILATLLTLAALIFVALPLHAHHEKPVPDGVVSVDTVDWISPAFLDRKAGEIQALAPQQNGDWLTLTGWF